MTKKVNLVKVPNNKSEVEEDKVQSADVTLTKQGVLNLLSTRGFTKLSQNEVIAAPIKYWLRRFRRELLTIAKGIDEVRMSSLTAISEKDENGNPKKDKMNQFVVPPELLSKFEVEFNTLLKENAEFSFRKIVINLSEFPDNVLSASDMNDLEEIVIFIEPEEEEKEGK